MKRKGISISILVVIVITIFIAAALILFITSPSSRLNIFSSEKMKESTESIDSALISMDPNHVNFNTTEAASRLDIVMNITSSDTITHCSTPSEYCDNITVSLSTAPPKYSTTPEGITIKVAFDEPISELEGYVNITLSGIYEFGDVMSSGGNLPACTYPWTKTCYTEQPLPPEPLLTTLTLSIRLGQDISVKVPFYYDNLNPRGISDEEDLLCMSYPHYSNLIPQATNISINSEGPSSPYTFTIVHMEKPHEREYAVHRCVANGTHSVQVVSGRYDLFRVFGWDPVKPGCISVKDGIIVEKGRTKTVTLKFDC
ncbi:MAG: hypothetical protein U9P44_01475 [archaeon]|nr:hypothetical protein [archaeon]